jgi:hypothetical protein
MIMKNLIRISVILIASFASATSFAETFSTSGINLAPSSSEINRIDGTITATITDIDVANQAIILDPKMVFKSEVFGQKEVSILLTDDSEKFLCDYFGFGTPNSIIDNTHWKQISAPYYLQLSQVDGNWQFIQNNKPWLSYPRVMSCLSFKYPHH